MEKYLTLGDARIWTISEGQGIPFLLCNGGPGCDDYLGPVSQMVGDMCRVIRFEPRGCGRSTYDGNYDLETTIGDIEAIRVAYGVEQWIIGGHSAGPDVALAYAIRYPKHVLGMIGIAGGRVVNDREWSKIYKQNLAEQGEDYGGKVFVADPLVNKMGMASWRGYIQRPTLLKEIAEISVPAIFINAENDIRPNWPTQQLAHLIPLGQYVEIPGATHSIWLTHGAELKTALTKAINEIVNHPSS